MGTLLLAALAAHGCRDSGDEVGTITLRVMNWATDLELQSEERLAEQFEAAHPGVRVLVESIVTNYGEKLITAIASGVPPDVFLLDSPDIPAFVERGLALDLAPYASRVNYDPKSVFPSVLEVFGSGERLYAFPKGFSPFVIYYNRHLFRELNVPEPPADGWTWEEFIETARAITRDIDGDGRTDIYAINFPRRFYEWIPFVWSAGADVLDPEGRRTRGYLDSGPTVDTFRFLTSLVTDWQVVPPLNFQDEGDPMRVGRFYIGKQAMLASGHWHMPRLRHYAQFGGLELGIAQIPHRPGATFETVLYASGWAVPTNVRHKRLAVELAAFLASEQAQRLRAASGLEIPAMQAVAGELAAADELGLEREFLSQISSGRATWGARVLDFHEVERMSLDIMDSHLLQGTPLDSAALEVARQIDEVIAR